MGNDDVPRYQFLTEYGLGNGATFGTDNAVNQSTYMVRTANPLITWSTNGAVKPQKINLI